MAGESDLSANFTAIGLPPEARAWLLDLWHVIQTLDDAQDGDKADNVGRAARAIFWDMPLNPFYQRFSTALQPVLMLAVLKWEAANAVEAAGEADEQSYMWRGEFYGVVLMACHLCGISAPVQALRLYGETFQEYIAEWRQPCQAL